MDYLIARDVLQGGVLPLLALPLQPLHKIHYHRDDEINLCALDSVCFLSLSDA